MIWYVNNKLHCRDCYAVINNDVFKGEGAVFSNDLFLSGCIRIQVEDIISGSKWQGCKSVCKNINALLCNPLFFVAW